MTSLHSSEGSRVVVDNPTERSPIPRPTYVPSKNPIPKPSVKPSGEPSVTMNEPSRRSYFTLNPTIHRGTQPNSIANSIVNPNNLLIENEWIASHQHHYQPWNPTTSGRNGSSKNPIESGSSSSWTDAATTVAQADDGTSASSA